MSLYIIVTDTGALTGDVLRQYSPTDASAIVQVVTSGPVTDETVRVQVTCRGRGIKGCGISGQGNIHEIQLGGIVIYSNSNIIINLFILLL